MNGRNERQRPHNSIGGEIKCVKAARIQLAFQHLVDVSPVPKVVQESYARIRVSACAKQANSCMLVITCFGE